MASIIFFVLQDDIAPYYPSSIKPPAVDFQVQHINIKRSVDGPFIVSSSGMYCIPIKTACWLTGRFGPADCYIAGTPVVVLLFNEMYIYILERQYTMHMDMIWRTYLCSMILDTYLSFMISPEYMISNVYLWLFIKKSDMIWDKSSILAATYVISGTNSWPKSSILLNLFFDSKVFLHKSYWTLDR